MEPHELVYQLEQLAEKLGIEVRYEELESDGGMCEIGGRKVLFVSDAIPDIDKVALMARELSSFDTERFYLLPEVREVLEKYARR